MSDSRKPLKPADVDVSVKPVEKPLPRRGREREATKESNEENKRYAKKVERALDGEVKKAVADNAGKGRRSQRDAAEKTAERVAGDLPRENIDSIVITVDGDGSTEIKPKR